MWVVRANGNKVATFDTGLKAIKRVHTEMTAWYVRNAAQQQLKDRMMEQMMGSMTSQREAAAAEAITAVDPLATRRAEIAAALAKRGPR